MEWVINGGTILLSLIGAATGIIALLLQRGSNAAANRERAAERSRTVTPQWIIRDLDRPNSLGQTREWGLRVQNHARVPVHNVRIVATAKGHDCDLPTLDPLQSGEMFIRKDSAADDARFQVRRMGANVVTTEAILTPTWRVHRIDFELEGGQVSWSAAGSRSPR